MLHALGRSASVAESFVVVFAGVVVVVVIAAFAVLVVVVVVVDLLPARPLDRVNCVGGSRWRFDLNAMFVAKSVWASCLGGAKRS